MKPDVVLTPCKDYSQGEVESALARVLEPLGGLDWVKPGMKIAIKANLVTFLKPERAATTHPSLLCALVRMLTERGADVVVGDSPGGLYNAAYVKRVYQATGMEQVEQAGGCLNWDFSHAQGEYPEGKVCRQFTYTAYLSKADAIINFCKLKTHGMMAMTCGAKNMFGSIPGAMKPEYHFRFPDPRDFARMIVDLDEYFKPRLTIVDAVTCMEGNGPTGGTPRYVGLLAASESPHKADLVCAQLLGLRREEVPTLEAALERGLIPPTVEELTVQGNVEDFVVPDFQRIETGNGHLFEGDGKHLSKRLRGAVMAKVFSQKPKVVKQHCVGCGVCANICPAKTITIEKGKAVVHRDKCIRCFCCQEFCPKSAMVVHRTWVARLLER